MQISYRYDTSTNSTNTRYLKYWPFSTISTNGPEIISLCHVQIHPLLLMCSIQIVLFWSSNHTDKWSVCTVTGTGSAVATDLWIVTCNFCLSQAFVAALCTHTHTHTHTHTPLIHSLTHSPNDSLTSYPFNQWLIHPMNHSTNDSFTQ